MIARIAVDHLGLIVIVGMRWDERVTNGRIIPYNMVQGQGN
jgi:hypothetical protein